jgi:hypothetical protein
MRLNKTIKKPFVSGENSEMALPRSQSCSFPKTGKRFRSKFRMKISAATPCCQRELIDERNLKSQNKFDIK